MSYEKIFSPIEEVWMEKKNISQYVINDGGEMKNVHLDVKKDNEDNFIVILNLTVAGIDELSEDSENGILDEIEWATDEISDDEWMEVGLDPELLQDFEINLIIE